MTGSGVYQTRPLSNFGTSLNKLVKKHYRKNHQARQEFEDLIEGFLKQMRSSPRPPDTVGHREPWPRGTAQEGFELWKIHFAMPGIQGAAGEGRLVYLISEEDQMVHLVWIYTHDEFDKRPPEKEMGRLLKSVMREQ